MVRGIGLIGGGEDPISGPCAAKRRLKRRRFCAARKIAASRKSARSSSPSTNSVPIRVEHVVDGGPCGPATNSAQRGVIVGHQTRQGRAGHQPPDDEAKHGDEVLDTAASAIGSTSSDKVQGIILLRKRRAVDPGLAATSSAKIEELNNPPGRLLPGVKIEPFYNRSRTDRRHHRDRAREPRRRHGAGDR